MSRRMIVFLPLLVALLIIPAVAQDSVLNTVTFNDFSFGYDSAVATGVNIYQFPGEPVDLEQMGGPEPPSTSFTLYNQLPVPEFSRESAGQIHIYDMER